MKVTVDPYRFESYLLYSLWRNIQNTVKPKEKQSIIKTPHPQIFSIAQSPPRAMAVRFDPLALPDVLHDLP